MTFNIWVDADSVPKNLRSIILKLALRTRLFIFFCADRSLSDVIFVAKSNSNVKMVVVQSKENSADDYIVDNANNSDLCITHDILLASRLLKKGCYVIDDRGGTYSFENIKLLLYNRSVNAQLREMGVFADLTKKQSSKNVQDFANNLDKTVCKILKL